MVGGKFLGVLLVQLVWLVAVTIQDDMCGLPAPDPTKTCISVRLPWNPIPMYFCTEKAKFRYRNQCQNRFTTACGITSTRQDTLMVASPWDCCPLVSYPDSCMNQQCAPAPIGRKCQVMEPNLNTPWECCENYFCEENMTPETCHFRRLEPACNTMPQGKTNCVAFVDPFGCCPKFQCDGDTMKPGHCPAEVEALKFMARFNSSNMMMMGPGYPMMPGGPGMMMGPGGAGAAAVAGSVSVQPGQAEMHVEAPPAPADAPPARLAAGVGGYISSFPNPAQNMIACVGDFNCPGSMKCCSNDLNVYVHDGRHFFRNRNPTYGYCMEPGATSGMNTRSIKYTAAQ